MRVKNMSMLGAALLAVAPVLAPVARAQEPLPASAGPMVFFQDGGQGMKARAEFFATEMAFDGAVVKNAPYSADAVTESVQTLGDGNRIVSTTRSAIFRDSEGRTRREQTLGAVGPWTSGEPRQIILVNDPVAGVNYVLQPDAHTARRLPAQRMFVTTTPEGNSGAVRTTRGVVNGDRLVVTTTDVAGPLVAASAQGGPVAAGGIGASSGPVTVVPAAGPRFEVLVPDSKDAKKESLGTKVVEGIECEGTRSTTTIAAGAIGNERPIDIVSEQWYSPELQTVVSSTHSDPRFGETTFRLTNVTRAEPARSLFEVPSEYVIQDLSAQPVRVEMRREIEKKAAPNN
jgi:hypothetical protein